MPTIAHFQDLRRLARYGARDIHDADPHCLCHGTPFMAGADRMGA
ncbi:hypothetical protein DFP85_102191 [Halomonas ventosae]|uniref:Uncharacterized protein n=1 Tax=Halomonas ventosae TaxID=229007 RepID=A0A4R6ZVW8_9GAMM|nr:hypothetical protein [Halomonas ventosae]TDR57013.1 hypothetical protein DFP85_102191 [Halomonas ventosae]